MKISLCAWFYIKFDMKVKMSCKSISWYPLLLISLYYNDYVHSFYQQLDCAYYVLDFEHRKILSSSTVYKELTIMGESDT